MTVLNRAGLVADPPPVARLLETARAYELTAQLLERAHPPRRATSRLGQVDVAADGRLLALRVGSLDDGAARDRLAGELLALSRLLTSGERPADLAEAVVEDLPPEDVPPVPLLGAQRLHFPPGIEDDAPPAVAWEQLKARLHRRWQAGQAAAERLRECTGEGAAADGLVVVRLDSTASLAGLTIASQATAMTTQALDAALAGAIVSARASLRVAMEAALERAAGR